jgi:hypothetical protein
LAHFSLRELLITPKFIRFFGPATNDRMGVESPYRFGGQGMSDDAERLAEPPIVAVKKS